MKRLKELEAENGRLRRAVSDRRYGYRQITALLWDAGSRSAPAGRYSMVG